MKDYRGFITNHRALPYNPDLKNRAREMRNNSTKGEIKFWCDLVRNKKCGYKFYRQKTILNYIVDFYCAQLKLVVEIDGTSHLGKEEYDKVREEDLKSLGLKILRYNDIQLLYNFGNIEKQFLKDIAERAAELEKYK
jgi:very-short-patch-repair endonuclease